MGGWNSWYSGYYDFATTLLLMCKHNFLCTRSFKIHNLNLVMGMQKFMKFNTDP